MPRHAKTVELPPSNTASIKMKECKKPKKEKKISKTLDTHHKNIMIEISKKKDSLPILKENLTETKKSLKIIDAKSTYATTPHDIRQKPILKDRIKKIQAEIDDINNNVYETDYYYKTSEYLVNYYDDEERRKKNGFRDSIGLKTVCEESSDDEDYSSPVVKLHPNNLKRLLETSRKEMKQLVKKKKSTISKAEIYNSYLSLIDPSYRKGKGATVKICKECDIEQILNKDDGIFMCEKCGISSIILIDTDKTNYKDPGPNTSASYKRINHLNEILSQLQGKESTLIPIEIYDYILKEISKHKKLAEDLILLTPEIMRKILKNIGLQKYFEHIQYIINKLNGIPPLKFSRKDEEKIRSMFKEIQEPFQKCCPVTRKNFLNYFYIIRKFCELLELDEHLPHLPLLKNPEKLQLQDKIWKKMCVLLSWEFIASCRY